MSESGFQELPSADPIPTGSDWEIRFYEAILRRSPDYVEVLAQLGRIYTENRRYADGLKMDQHLAMLKQDDPIVHYNLACSYALVGQTDRAFEALEAAVRLGYKDVDHMEQDGDMKSIRPDPRYAAIVARMQQKDR